MYMYMLVLSQTIVKYLYTVYVYCGNKCFEFRAFLEGCGSFSELHYQSPRIASSVRQ